MIAAMPRDYVSFIVAEPPYYYFRSFWSQLLLFDFSLVVAALEAFPLPALTTPILRYYASLSGAMPILRLLRY